MQKTLNRLFCGESEVLMPKKTFAKAGREFNLHIATAKYFSAQFV